MQEYRQKKQKQGWMQKKNKKLVHLSIIILAQVSTLVVSSDLYK